MKYIILNIFPKLGKMSQNLSSAAVVTGALRVNSPAVFQGLPVYEQDGPKSLT